MIKKVSRPASASKCKILGLFFSWFWASLRNVIYSCASLLQNKNLYPQGTTYLCKWLIWFASRHRFIGWVLVWRWVCCFGGMQSCLSSQGIMDFCVATFLFSLFLLAWLSGGYHGSFPLFLVQNFGHLYRNCVFFLLRYPPAESKFLFRHCFWRYELQILQASRSGVLRRWSLPSFCACALNSVLNLLPPSQSL